MKKYGIKVDYFCDNNIKMVGQIITSDGIYCLSPEEVFKMENTDIFIASTSVDEIKNQILHSRFAGNIITTPVDMLVFMSIALSELEDMNKEIVKNKIARIFDILEDEQSQRTLYFKIWGWFVTPEEMKNYVFDDILVPNQYIPDGIIDLDNTSIIVDCGAYCGDTLEFFIDQGVEFQKYIGYELDKDNFQLLNNFVNTSNQIVKSNVEVYNLGVSDSERTLTFFSKNFSSLILNEDEHSEGDTSVGKVVALDTHLRECNVSYIKMDIEGSEMSALRGAEKLIMHKHPDCAICIYHKATDLWEIPLFLKSCYPDYKFYIRHHANCYFDTVCYAIGGNRK